MYHKLCECVFVAGTHSLCDVDLDHCRGAEGRLSSVPGLHHQRPGAVPLLGDVLNDGHGLDVGLEHDLPSVSVDVEDVVVRFGLHDGVLNHIVGNFCVVVHGLCCLRARSMREGSFLTTRPYSAVMRVPLFSQAHRSPWWSPGSCC